MAVFKLTRRRVLTSLTGGAALVGGTGLWLGVRKVQGERFRKPVDRGGFSPSVYLGIQRDGAVDIWLTRSEMGQGVSTALPMLVAEELDADWQRVRVHQARAEASFDYGQLRTAASSSVASQWTELRRAGAVAREMLVSAAADRWGVAADACTTSNGHVRCGDRVAGYGELAEAAARQWVPIRPTLKSPEAFTLIGRSPPRLDAPGKVTGHTVYGSDVALPNLLRAVVLRPPAVGQSLVDWDATAAKAVPGVRDVFEIDSGIAVVATGTFAAFRGREQLSVQWSPVGEPLLSSTAVDAALEYGLHDAAASADADPSERAAPGSDAASGHAASYHAPFLAHACMEPMNCTVHLDGSGCEVWVGTQAPEGARATVARITGVHPDRVVVNVLPLGGGFGRRTAQDFVAEAAQIAVRTNAPVQLLWSREDDLGHAQYRDAVAIRLSAVLDSNGSPRQVDYRVASSVLPPGRQQAGLGPLMGAETPVYRLQDWTVRWTGVPIPVPVTIWRSVGYSYNTFAIECFVDELALRAEQDPLTYRRALLAADDPLVRCIDEVSVMARWGERRHRSLGAATYRFASTSVAMIAEVRTSGQDWRVSRVWCSVDCGTVVHRDAAAAQIEGGILYGLSAALYERVRLSEGRVANRNFHTYRVARMEDAPEIEVSFIPSEGYPGGLGEASTPGIAPAVSNALYQATGERYRRLPFLS